MVYNFDIPCSDDDHARNYYLAVMKAKSLFGVDYFLGNPGWETLFGKLFQNVFYSNLRGDTITRGTELIKIWYLLKHLEVIKSYDNKLFLTFKSNLLKKTDMGNYYGIQAEIMTASQLVSTNLQFLKTKPPKPDFMIYYKSDVLGIEVTNTHLYGPKSGDLTNKIWDEIKSKEGKPNANPKTLLIIDYTNLILQSGFDQNLLDCGKLKSLLKSDVNPAKFGSILLTFSRYVFEKRRYRIIYNRLDNVTPNTNLKEFLDIYYPIEPVLAT